MAYGGSRASREGRDGKAGLRHKMAERTGNSVNEAAEKLGVNKKTIYRAIQEGQLPAIRLGRKVIIIPAVIDRMLQEGRNPA